MVSPRGLTSVTVPFFMPSIKISSSDGFGNIRMSDGDEELFNEGVYDLLESTDCEYSIGRTTATFVIETPSLDKIGIHRIDLIEDLKPR